MKQQLMVGVCRRPLVVEAIRATIRRMEAERDMYFQRAADHSAKMKALAEV